MRKLIQAPNAALATLWADLLAQGGIEASVQHYFTSSIVGEIPPDQGLPEVWVHDDAMFERARTLLAELRHPRWRHWSCPGCGEMVDGPFEECWQCGTRMPA